MHGSGIARRRSNAAREFQRNSVAPRRIHVRMQDRLRRCGRRLGVVGRSAGGGAEARRIDHDEKCRCQRLPRRKNQGRSGAIGGLSRRGQKVARQASRGRGCLAQTGPATVPRWRLAFERKYSLRSVVDGHYVSIVRSDYMDTHGAHPNSDLDTVLWDAAAKKRISIRPFFTETADNGSTMTAMREAVIASLNLEKKKRDSS